MTYSGTKGLLPLSGGDAVLHEKILACCVIRTVKSGTSVIGQDDTDDAVYLILSGQARVVLQSRGGHELWLNDLKPGDIFGEMAVLLGAARTSGVIASSDVTLGVMPAAAFSALMDTELKFAKALAIMQAQRVKVTSQRMFEGGAMSVPGRVYSELLREAHPDPKDAEIHIITPPVTVSDFARKVNASRESVSRAISQFEREGLLRRHADHWRILAPNLDALEID